MVSADGGVDVGRDDAPGDEMDMSLLSERVAQLDGTAEVGRSDDGGVTVPAWVSV
jgi:signal transduction histidine kinase